MSDFVVDKFIPLPKPRQHGGDRLSDAIKSMGVGDSILVGAESADVLSHTAARILGRGNYACRKQENGTRMWRIA